MNAMDVIERRIKELEASLEKAKMSMKEGIKMLHVDGIDSSEFHNAAAMTILKLQIRINELYNLQIAIMSNSSSYKTEEQE